MRFSSRIFIIQLIADKAFSLHKGTIHPKSQAYLNETVQEIVHVGYTPGLDSIQISHPSSTARCLEINSYS